MCDHGHEACTEAALVFRFYRNVLLLPNDGSDAEEALLFPEEGHTNSLCSQEIHTKVDRIHACRKENRIKNKISVLSEIIHSFRRKFRRRKEDDDTNRVMKRSEKMSWHETTFERRTQSIMKTDQRRKRRLPLFSVEENKKKETTDRVLRIVFLQLKSSLAFCLAWHEDMSLTDYLSSHKIHKKTYECLTSWTGLLRLLFLKTLSRNLMMAFEQREIKCRRNMLCILPCLSSSFPHLFCSVLLLCTNDSISWERRYLIRETKVSLECLLLSLFLTMNWSDDSPFPFDCCHCSAHSSCPFLSNTKRTGVFVLHVICFFFLTFDLRRELPKEQRQEQVSRESHENAVVSWESPEETQRKKVTNEKNCNSNCYY